jgi:hypothetical protein
MRRSGHATLLRRRYSGETGVTAMLIVEGFIVLELPLEITLAPEPGPVQVLAPDGSNQPLDKGMRSRRIGDGLNLLDLEHPQIRAPAMKAEQGIVVRGKAPGHSLLRDRAIEHPAHPDAVEIGRGNPKADDPTVPCLQSTLRIHPS